MMVSYGTQLPLAFGPSEAFTFEHFLIGSNHEAVEKLQALMDLSTTETIFVHGAPGTGKSHLLQALCRALSATQTPSVYLPLTHKKKFTPQILEGLEELPVICLDDVDQIAADPEWEQALFHLFNRVQEAGHSLILTARSAPHQIAFQLQDLASRMNWGLIYQLQDLSDTEKLQVLQNKANLRGFDLTTEVGEFLIKRLPRDMHALCDFLEKLDVASLAAKRKLTVPFVKELLEAGP